MINIMYDNKKYPQILRNIKNPPKSLWIEGNVDLLNEICFTIVGSRNCSDYGEKWCKKFTKDLIEYNIVIVSGMARGIDSIAHNTALKYGGKTIAVLPSGINNIYPKENIMLYKNIIENDGAVISEYMPDEKCLKKNFLERNRIVSGLGIGTLVIEAGYRSGTSVTARYTHENNKNVFCVPGSLDNKRSYGTNIMIKKGAKLVTEINDIISNYSFLNKVNIINEEEIYNIDDELKNTYELILAGFTDVNSISKKLGEDVHKVMIKITMLEIDGKIKKIGGNRYGKV